MQGCDVTWEEESRAMPWKGVRDDHEDIVLTYTQAHQQDQLLPRRAAYARLEWQEGVPASPSCEYESARPFPFPATHRSQLTPSP